MVTPGSGIEEMEVMDAVGLDKGVLIPFQSPCKRLQDRLAFQDTTEVFLYYVGSWLYLVLHTWHSSALSDCVPLLRASWSCRQSHPHRWQHTSTYKSKREILSCPGRAHQDCLSNNYCTTLQELQAFVPLALACYYLAWPKPPPCNFFFFLYHRKISKAAGKCSPGDISEETTV